MKDLHKKHFYIGVSEKRKLFEVIYRTINDVPLALPRRTKQKGPTKLHQVCRQKIAFPSLTFCKPQTTQTGHYLESLHEQASEYCCPSLCKSFSLYVLLYEAILSNFLKFHLNSSTILDFLNTVTMVTKSAGLLIFITWYVVDEEAWNQTTEKIFLTSIYGGRGLWRGRVKTLQNTCSTQNLKLRCFILNGQKPKMIVQNYFQGWESHASDVDRRSWDVHQWRSSFPHQGKRLLKLSSPQL